MNVHPRFGHNHGPRFLTEEDLDAYRDYFAAQARTNFWAYRQFMDPGMIQGWWPREVSHKLQLFYKRLKAGKRPKLVLEAPPQHGKSRGLIDFCGWIAGVDPDLRQIYASFSRDLGVIANTGMQRQLDNPNYQLVFPGTTISKSNVLTGATRPKRNSSFMEFVGHKGSFRNTTVNGQITGKGLDFGLIDDPIKGRAEASSKVQRDKAWNWLMDDYFTRFSDQAGMILTATRWHVDDPTGRFILKFPNCIVLRYPAISTAEDVRQYDPRMSPGIPLFPEFKSLDFLMERKGSATRSSWESLYQQSPIVEGGGIFPVDRIKIVKGRPLNSDVKKVVRYWDKAGTTDAGAYTAGVRCLELHSGGWIIDSVVRGQWGAFVREQKIKATAERDEIEFGAYVVSTYVEQEPGSGGKESAERTIANLAGHKVYADRVTGKKEVRAEPYAAQWQGGNIALLYAPWNDDFLDEHEAFPSAKYKDQVDAAAGAFAQTVGKKYKYDGSMSWVGEEVNG
jgi:predicted phage terminase large subunit-like protein